MIDSNYLRVFILLTTHFCCIQSGPIDRWNAYMSLVSSQIKGQSSNFLNFSLTVEGRSWDFMSWAEFQQFQVELLYADNNEWKSYQPMKLQDLPLHNKGTPFLSDNYIDFEGLKSSKLHMIRYHINGYSWCNLEGSITSTRALPHAPKPQIKLTKFYVYDEQDGNGRRINLVIKAQPENVKVRVVLDVSTNYDKLIDDKEMSIYDSGSKPGIYEYYRYNVSSPGEKVVKLIATMDDGRTDNIPTCFTWTFTGTYTRNYVTQNIRETTC